MSTKQALIRWTKDQRKLLIGLTGSDLSTATLTGATWSNTICPDGTNSDANGNTCIGHLVP